MQGLNGVFCKTFSKVTLVIDIDCGPDSAILEGLHYFRIQRPDARIIILAADREPGDVTLAKVTAKGIYDIVTPGKNEEIKEVIKKAISSKPATYTQAARFMQELEAKRQQAQQEIIIQQKPLGLTVIAVAGAGSGAGVSHISLAIASHIGKAGNRVMLAEYPTAKKPPNFKPGLPGQYQSYGRLVRAVTENEIIKTKYFDILANARPRYSSRYIWGKVSRHQYDYLVFDLGELTPEKIPEMDRAALPVLVTSAAPYRYEHLIPILDPKDFKFYTPNLRNWIIILNLNNENFEKWFKSTFSKFIPGPVFSLGYFADPVADVPEIIQEIINPVMPVQYTKPKKSLLERILRKGDIR